MGLLNFSEIMDRIEKLEEANLLFAALKFKIFTHLGKALRTSKFIANQANLNPEGTEAMLDALCAMKVLIKEKTKYKNSSETYKYLCETSKHYKKGTIFLKQDMREEWSELLEVIKNGRNLEAFEGQDDPEYRELFTYAMHERSEKYSKLLAKFVARKPVGKLLDVGGGPGTYSSEILKLDKQSKVSIVDRPHSLKVAKDLLKPKSSYKRFTFCPGDIFQVEFESENDTVLYSNILHIYSEKENLVLLKKIHSCLKPGGRLIVVDLFLNEARTRPCDAAMFSLSMLMYTKTGRTYGAKETKTLLRKTGFSKFQTLELVRGSSVIECEKN